MDNSCQNRLDIKDRLPYTGNIRGLLESQRQTDAVFRIAGVMAVD